ncbi:molybdopterin-dependent oxidoreductase [Hippea jasoniae]|uniref:molybdopterin-dependent oxidoreductase n=1 Tax=Hippea jasoniae TaxID=944479 RepID=UPI00054D1FB7|nr:molybdopterin-dependent oxidoreductase [Hippea jasoniae]
MDWIEQFCAKDCPDTCAFLARIENNKLKIKPKGWDFLKKPFVCGKLKQFFNREIAFNDASCMVSGKPVLLDEAIKAAVKIIKSSKRILYYRGSGNLGYSMFVWDLLLAKFENVYFVDGSPCDETGIEAHIEDFGVCINPPIENLINSDAIVIFGKNAHAVSPHLFALLKQLSKTKEIVYIDPVKTQAASIGRYIRINPASDGALAKALLDELDGFTKNGNDAFEETGLTDEEFEYLKDIFKKKKVAIIEGYGLQRYVNGKNTIKWLNRLAYFTGNLDRLYYSRSSKEGLKKPAVKPKNSIFISELTNYIKEGFFDGAIIVASNPLISLPDNDVLTDFFENNPTVVVDANCTQTAALADVFIRVGGMFSQKDIQGSYFFPKTLKKEKLIDLPNDVDVAKRLAAIFNCTIDFSTDNIEDKRSLKRKINFEEIDLKKPFNIKDKVRLLNISHHAYLNSQWDLKSFSRVYVSPQLKEKYTLVKGQRVFLKNLSKKAVFEVELSDKIYGDIAFVYKDSSKYVNYICSNIPTDTKRGIAFNDTFVEIVKL